MSEKEKKIIETIAEALPNMSERDKGYFLGYAEAKVDKTPADREQEKRRGGELSESIKPTDIHGYRAEHTALVHDSAAAIRV